MRVLVCGDRNWANRFSFMNGPTEKSVDDFNYMMAVLEEVKQLRGIDLIIQGEARGADQCARYWAWLSSTPMLSFPADWDKYGKGAGPIRNKQMLEEGKPDLVLAFHRAFNQSKGTRHMVELARKSGVEVEILPTREER